MSKAENELDTSKPAWHFMPFAALDEVAMVFGYGAAKHGAGDYVGPDAPTERYNIGAALRHTSLHMQGEVYDRDSGYAHIAHAVARLLIVLERRFRVPECSPHCEEAIDSLLGVTYDPKEFRRVIDEACPPVSDEALEAMKHTAPTPWRLIKEAQELRERQRDADRIIEYITEQVNEAARKADEEDAKLGIAAAPTEKSKRGRPRRQFSEVKTRKALRIYSSTGCISAVAGYLEANRRIAKDFLKRHNAL